MKTVTLKNGNYYQIGDVLRISKLIKIEDSGVRMWGYGLKKITGFEKKKRMTNIYEGEKEIIVFVFDDFFRFREDQIIKYFKKLYKNTQHNTKY